MVSRPKTTVFLTIQMDHGIQYTKSQINLVWQNFQKSQIVVGALDMFKLVRMEVHRLRDEAQLRKRF